MDACVLEARLASATVLRLDAKESGDSSWAAVRALIRILFRELPDETRMAVESQVSILGHILPELLDEGEMPKAKLTEFTSPQELHPRLQETLYNLFLQLSRVRYLVLAVDNLRYMDEPSLSFLALLSHNFSAIRITMVVVLGEGARSSSASAVEILGKNSEILRLENLDRKDMDALLASVFGDIPNLNLLADSLYSVSKGNPRAAMQLAQYLVDKGVVYYRAGAWTIPSQIDGSDIPLSLKDAMAAQAATLDDEEYRLAEVLALNSDRSASFDECLELTEHRDRARLIRSLNNLQSADILFFDGERFGFHHQGWVPLFTDTLSKDRRRELHLKLAQMFHSKNNDSFREAKFLLLAGEEKRALRLLSQSIQETAQKHAQNVNAFSDFFNQLPKDWMSIFEKALEVAERLERGQKELFLLRRRFCILTSFIGTTKLVHYRKLIEQLYRASGLDIYEKTVPTSEPGERLAAALEQARIRYESLPEDERVLSPKEAAWALIWTSLNAAMVALMAHDYDFLDSLPSVEPLAPLSPAVSIVQQLLLGVRDVLAARYNQARDRYLEVLGRLEQEDRAGLDETVHRLLNDGVNYALGFVEASFGLSSGSLRADKIEESPFHEINAWCIRLIYYLRQGNVWEAERAKKRVEILQLQNNPPQFLEGAYLFAELLARSLADDLSGVRYIIDDLKRMADRFENWQPILYFARGEYQRIRGDYEAALSLLERALELARPGRDPSWAYIAGAALKTLYALGRVDQALKLGRELLATAQSENIIQAREHIAMPLSLIEEVTGNSKRAISLIQTVIDGNERLGTTGLNLGLGYETRALLAAMMGDRENFEVYARLAAEQYKIFDNPVLKSKYEKLILEARRRNISVSSELEQEVDFSGGLAGDVVGQISDILSRCVTPGQRARLALTILMEQAGAQGGFLFGLDADDMILMSQLADDEPSLELIGQIKAYMDLQIGDYGDSTTADMDDSSIVDLQWVGDKGFYYRPFLLGHMDRHGYRITGLAVLIFENGTRCKSVGATSIVLSRILQDKGDVEGLLI